VIVPIEEANDQVVKLQVLLEQVNADDEERLDLYLEALYYYLKDHTAYLPDLVKKYQTEFEESDCIFEMSSRIPGVAKIPGDPKAPGLIIAMGDDERDIHHFHVFRNENDKKIWSNGACLFLDDNAYYDHGRNKETLTEDELKAVIYRLEEPSSVPKFQGSNWEYLVSLWNANNPRYPVDPDLKMPDYDYKTIRRYKNRGR
jgi:hypothetical protein